MIPLYYENLNQAEKENYIFPDNPVVLDTKLTWGGNPVIEVEVNGKMKKFWIDTGADMSVISSEVAIQCGVLPLEYVYNENSTAGTSTDKKIPIRPTVIKTLKLGSIQIENHPAIIIDKKNLEFKILGIFTILKIDGIIGWNAIQNMDIEIDFKSKSTKISKPEKRNNQISNLFWLRYPVVKMKTPNGADINFGIDTGANGTSIRDNIFKKIDTEFTRGNEKIFGAGGSEYFEVKEIKDFTLLLNNYSIYFKSIKTNPGKFAVFLTLDGLLGSDIFKNCKIRIDY